jgi:two-component system, NarL family, response regulator NreC
MENRSIHILIVDDHAPIIEGYKSILTYNTSGFNIETKQANSCESAYNMITKSDFVTPFDLVFIDITLPPFIEKNIHSGEDLVPHIKSHLPNSKIVILTSHTESLVLFRILNNCNPDGLLVKSDFTSDEFLTAFEVIVSGEKYYSKTITKLIKEVSDNSKILDYYNRQIIILLAQGVKTKNLHEHLHLSVSAIDKRKVAIKHFFGIEKGTDEDILREARKQGLI